MKLYLAACIAIFAVSCDDSSHSNESSPESEPQSTGESKSPELLVLDRFVGTWDIVGSHTLAGGEKTPVQSVALRKWSTDGTTLHFDDAGSNPDGPGIQVHQSFDLEKKHYAGVIKSVLGSGEFTGTWDGNTSTMSFKGAYEEGATFEGSNRFIDTDTIESKIILKNTDGELMLGSSSKQIRRKALGEAPAVDELLTSYHEAIGGLEAHKKISTRRMEGTITLFGQPEPAKLTVVQKAPDLMLVKFAIKDPTSGNLVDVLEGHDGKIIWKSNPVEGTAELQGSDRDEKLREYRFYKYLDLKSDFKTLTSKGRETGKGATYDVIEATREDGSSETLLFHAWTHLLSIVKRSDATIEMSAYQKSDGIASPGKTSVTIAGGPVVMTAIYSKIENGIEVDDAIFSKPEN
ncbi:MAG: hypothetical protein ABF382_01340 [Akkermansiaceae bacterium]